MPPDIEKAYPAVAGLNGGAAREHRAAANKSHYVRIPAPRLVGAVDPFPKYGGYGNYDCFLYRPGVSPSMCGDIVRLGELGGARRRPWPRVFTNVA